MCPIGTHKIDILHPDTFVEGIFHLEIIHEQLPLPVPCYDLLPVIELTLVPLE